MTFRHRIAIAAAALASVAVCHAGDVYGEAAAAYKAEIKRDEPALVNTGFISNLAASQARRIAANSAANAAAGGEPARDANGDLTGGDINVASPQIFGTVRGDVTIVTGSRGLPRGSITSVQR